MEFLFVIIALLAIVSMLAGVFFIGKLIYNKINSDELGDDELDTVDNDNTTEHKKETKMKSRPDFTNSIAVRFAIIGVIAFLMLIPLGKIGSVVDERSNLHDNVLHEIASQWGRPQVLSGPALVLPVVEKYNITETTKDKDGVERTTSKAVYKHKNIVILPKLLNEKISLKEKYLHRSIYNSLVYTADINVSGEFLIPNLSKLSDNIDKVRYDKAYLLMGLSDTKAIKNSPLLSFDDQKVSFEPGTQLILKGIDGGFHAPLELNADRKRYSFDFRIKANGSSYIRFAAFGEKSHIEVASPWQHPSFQGSVLPTEREISDSGFSATWEIPSLARNFPQAWIFEDHKYNVGSLLTGVDLFEPVALYSLIERSIKYGVLFILLTFLTFLVFELTQNSKLHYVQYMLIGFSLGLFFLTLLSLSEHIDFMMAYIIATCITVLSISLYSWFSTRSFKQTSIVMALLGALYAILYSLLHLEDYALLFGTMLLLAVLFVLMWITRNLKVGTKA